MLFTLNKNAFLSSALLIWITVRFSGELLMETGGGLWVGCCSVIKNLPGLCPCVLGGKFDILFTVVGVTLGPSGTTLEFMLIKQLSVNP